MNTPRPTVYIVQDKAGINFTPARAHGDLLFLLPPGTLYTDSTVTKARLLKGLKDIKDGDFLVLTGDPEAMALAYTAAMLLNNGRVRVLKWDNQCHVYNVVQHDWNAAMDAIESESARVLAREEAK